VKKSFKVAALLVAATLIGGAVAAGIRHRSTPQIQANLPLAFHQGTDGDLVTIDPTGQEIFLGDKLFVWTFHGREWDYANLTVESTKENVLISGSTEGRNGIRPVLKAGYLLRGFGPVWIRIRGGYLLSGSLPSLTFKVHLGEVLVAQKTYDFRLAGPITGTSGMGMETTFWIEPIAFQKPGSSLRIRCHQKGYASLGTKDSSGIWTTAETETYSTVDGTRPLPIEITAQWSDHTGKAEAYVDGIDIFR